MASNGPVIAVLGQILDAGVHESDRRRPRLRLCRIEHSARGVDRDDLGVGSRRQQRGRRCAGATARVEQPQTLAALGQAQSAAPTSREVGVVGRVGADQPVVFRGAGVEGVRARRRGAGPFYPR